MGKKIKVTAAGAVVLRGSAEHREVLVVHRPGYKDWCLPKGKPKPDEDLPVTAVREVLEETGCLIRLSYPLGSEVYEVPKGRKKVHWWIGHLISQTPRKADDEVDRVEWLPIAKALKKLSHPGEVEMLNRAVDAPATATFIVVRHGKAMDRKNWSSKDVDFNRPLSERGRRQAKRLVPLLQSYGVERATSSSSKRCMQTLKPFAESCELELEPLPSLSEESFDENPGATLRTMRELRDWSIDHRKKPLVVCGHRPVLPAMREAIDAPHKPMLTGEAQVLHIDKKGKVRAVENHKSRF